MAIVDKLTAVANAIRRKTGKTASLTLDQMVKEIDGIQTGGGSGGGGSGDITPSGGTLCSVTAMKGVPDIGTVAETITGAGADIFVVGEKYYLYYLYNGVRLYKIPDSMLDSSYTYLMLLRQLSNGAIYAYSSKTIPYYDGSSKLQLTSGRKRSLYDATTESWGSVNTSTSSTYCDLSSTWEIIWSEFDIPNGSATATDIYFEATEPVPTD